MTEEPEVKKPSAFRQEAEEILQGRPIEDVSRMLPEEIRNLVHELQVHQVELELQNKELREAHLQQEATRDKHVDLYDSAPIGYLTLNDAGRIIEANLAAAHLLGVERSILLEQPLTKFVARTDQDVYHLSQRALFSTRQPQSCELKIVRSDGSDFYALLRFAIATSQPPAHMRLIISDINKRKQAETALRESEAFLRSIYTGTDLAIYLIDVTADDDFVYAGCNPAFEKMTGRKGDSIIGRRPEELDPPQLPESMARARANYQRCVATGEAMEYEQKAIVRGQETWWLIRLEPLQDKDSRVYRIIATAIPITERKHAEEAYQTLVNHSLQGLAIYQHGRIVFTNVALAEITGYATSELLSMSPREVAQMTHPEDLAWVSQKVQDILAGKSVPPRERFRIVRKGGVIRWVEAYGRRIIYNGQAAMQVATVDVTERVLAEAALRESEERFRKVFEEGPLGMSIVDLAYRFVRVNARLCQMLGYAELEMVGLKIADLFHPQEVDDHLRQIQQVVDGELPYYQSEKRLLTKGSGMIWARVTGTVIRDEHNRPIYSLSMVEDVTERKRMEQYMLRFERLAAMGRMMATLAHEIKNPLQAIKSNVELVLGYLADPAEQEEYLQLSLEELNRLTDVTGRILKATAPANEEFHVIATADLLQQTLTLVNSSLLGAGIRLATHIPDNLPPVRVVPDQISQVLLNIMGNAIEATPRAGYIEISAGLNGDSIQLEFTNSGPPIRPEHLERIFDPFFTTKPKASGLGLSLSYTIMEQHGGTLAVRNRSDGQSVTFTLTLPFSSKDVVEQEVV